MQLLTRYHVIFGAFVCKKCPKIAETLRKGSNLREIRRNLSGSWKGKFQNHVFSVFDHQRNRFMSINREKMPFSEAFAKARAVAMITVCVIRAVTSSSLFRHSDDDAFVTTPVVKLSSQFADLLTFAL